MASTSEVNSAGTSSNPIGERLSTPRVAIVPASDDRLFSSFCNPKPTTIQPSGIVIRMGRAASSAPVWASSWRTLARCDTWMDASPSVAVKLRQFSSASPTTAKPGPACGGI